MLKPAKRRADEVATAADEPLKKRTTALNNKIQKPISNRSKTATIASVNRSVNSNSIKNKFTHKTKSSGKFDGNGRIDNKFNKNNSNKKFAGKKFGDDNVKIIEEKKDWVKFKQEKKELKLKRKQAKDSYEITQEAKQIYEKLKCRRTEKKSELVEQLYNLFSSGADTIQKIVMAHDTTRILQCMLKFASPTLRDQLSEKLLPHAVLMCQSKYSHFCVLRMLKYGSPNIKSKLVQGLFGHIVKLACHNIASKILDHIYLSVASSQQKIHMCQEFYGELYRKSKDDNVKTLDDTFKESANMKASIMGAVKSNLEHVANKQLVDSSLVHAVMLQYLQACDDDKLEETVSAFATLVPLMLTTKEGSQAATICFYKSTSKNRRAIIKNIKEHLIKIATHEHGHVFLIAVLNALDDTKATKKAIYDNVHAELQTLMANQYGRRVVQWLIAPADTNCFHPGFIVSIEQGLQYGKKDKEVRRKEIFEQIEESIAEAIAQDAAFWLSDNHIGLVTADILKKLSDVHYTKIAEALSVVIVQANWTVGVQDESADKKAKKKLPDFEAIISAATKKRKQLQKATVQNGVVNEASSENDEDENDDDSSDDDDNVLKTTASPAVTVSKTQVSGIEEAGMHIVLKKMIKNDKERAKDKEGVTFGSLLVEKLSEETLRYWLTVNRACFVLLNIVEHNESKTTDVLQQRLQKSGLTAILQQKQTKGAELLAKKLNII